LAIFRIALRVGTKFGLAVITVRVKMMLIDATGMGQGARFGVRTYKCHADAFLSGSMSDCVEKGFVKNATQPEATAALRTAGSSLPVM